jgi:hypothetical protein
MPTIKTTTASKRVTPAKQNQTTASKATASKASKAQDKASAKQAVRQATAEAIARQQARETAAELQRARANEIPEGKRSSISHASSKPIQKIAARTGGRLETEVLAWFASGDMRPGTKNELARALADVRASIHGNKAVDDKAIRSTRESIGRLIDSGALVLRDGVYTV